MGFQSGGMGSCRRTLDIARSPAILGKNILETGGQRSLLRTLRSSATTKALRATTHILWAWTEDKPQDADIRPAALAETVRLLRCLASVACRIRGVVQERLGLSYFFISLVLGPLNRLLWYVPSSRYVWSSYFVSARTNKRHHHHPQTWPPSTSCKP